MFRGFFLPSAVLTRMWPSFGITQIVLTCGEPSGFIVARCQNCGPSIAARTLSGNSTPMGHSFRIVRDATPAARGCVQRQHTALRVAVDESAGVLCNFAERSRVACNRHLTPEEEAVSDRLVVRNGFVVSMDAGVGNVPGADVLVEDGTIVEVGPGLAVGDAEEVDATGMIVI